MTTWTLLTDTWQLEPSVVAGSLALIVCYLAAVRSTGDGNVHIGRVWLFGLAVAVMLFALMSPLDTLGDTYLFSAHMLQHLLLILIVPPLLLLGIPPALIEQILTHALPRRIEQVLGYPVLAWLIGMVTLWIWHLPALYDAALESEAIHIVQHLSFLVSSTIFWWPVLKPQASCRLPVPAAILYLFGGALANSVLGIILAFAPAGIYPAYLHPVDRLGILPLLREQWGLSPTTDQQIGGLLMWIPGGLAYLFGIMGVFARWHAEPEADITLDWVNKDELGEGTPVLPVKGAAGVL